MRLPFLADFLKNRRASRRAGALGDTQLFFIHIPKTAGSSLRAILSEQLSPEAVFPYARLRQNLGYLPTPETLALPDEEFARYRVIAGHYEFPSMVGKFQRPPFCMTMLRKPFDRTISDIKHMLRHPNHGARRTLPDKDLTVATILDHEIARGYLTSRQRRTFGNSMEEAKNNLAGCDWVGIQERFRDSVKLLFHTLQWEDDGVIPRLNFAPAEQDALVATLSPEERDQIEGMIVEDNEIYQFACKLFDERWHAAFG